MTLSNRFAPSRQAAALLLIAMALLIPAIDNRFPLIFPDSGTYLGIAFGPEYALDRSSIYGVLFKPIASGLPSLTGLWLALAFQCLIVAGPLWLAARNVAGDDSRALLVVAATILVTSLAWHAAQFMPDAFTGATILLAWLAARRDPAADGAPLLWLAAFLAALIHYTHVPLLLAAAGATLITERLLGTAWRALSWRAAVLLATAAAAVLTQTALNGAIIGRAAMAPAGPLFIFARLNEDGLIAPWLADHCGRDAPPRLCLLAPQLPHGSQMLLWGGTHSPVPRLVWEAPPATRWQLVDEMDIANRGAIRDRPWPFLANAAAGAARQFIRFAAIDDECPDNCRTIRGGVGQRLLDQRPAAFAAFTASRQYRGTSPKSPVRALTGPLAWLALIVLPFAIAVAWRRRDRDALGLGAAIGVSLLLNAAFAGALSDVHDRYQSRVIWLIPFFLMLLLARWWRPLPTSLAVNGAPTHSGRQDGQV